MILYKSDTLLIQTFSVVAIAVGVDCRKLTLLLPENTVSEIHVKLGLNNNYFPIKEIQQQHKLYRYYQIKLKLNLQHNILIQKR